MSTYYLLLDDILGAFVSMGPSIKGRVVVGQLAVRLLSIAGVDIVAVCREVVGRL